METRRRLLGDHEDFKESSKGVDCVVKLCGVIGLIVGVELLLLLLVPVMVRPVPHHVVTNQDYPAVDTETKPVSNIESKIEPLKKPGSNYEPLNKPGANSAPSKKPGSKLVPSCISVLCIPWWVYLVCGGVVVCMVVCTMVWVCLGEILLAGWVQTRARSQGYVEII